MKRIALAAILSTLIAPGVTASAVDAETGDDSSLTPSETCEVWRDSGARCVLGIGPFAVAVLPGSYVAIGDPGTSEYRQVNLENTASFAANLTLRSLSRSHTVRTNPHSVCGKQRPGTAIDVEAGADVVSSTLEVSYGLGTPEAKTFSDAGRIRICIAR